MTEPVRNLLSVAGVARLVDETLIRFAVIGLGTTLMDLVLFSALTSGAGINPVVANVFSYSCGIVTSFLLNRSWTFGVPKGTRGIERQALRFVSTHLASLLLSSLLVALFVMMLPPFAAKVLSVPLVFLWNYALARFWVFRR